MSQSLPSDTLDMKKNQINIGINSFPFVIPYYYSSGNYLGQKDVFNDYNKFYNAYLYQITYKRVITTKRRKQRTFRTGIDFYYEQKQGSYNSTRTTYAGIIRVGIEWNKPKQSAKWRFYYGFDSGVIYHRNIDIEPFYPATYNEYTYGIGVEGLIGIEKKIGRRISISSEFSLAIAFVQQTYSSPWSNNVQTGFLGGANRIFGLTFNYHFISNKNK